MSLNLLPRRENRRHDRTYGRDTGVDAFNVIIDTGELGDDTPTFRHACSSPNLFVIFEKEWM
jgi:hypothetical protein